jgi:hypothetical protein
METETRPAQPADDEAADQRDQPQAQAAPGQGADASDGRRKTEAMVARLTDEALWRIAEDASREYFHAHPGGRYDDDGDRMAQFRAVAAAVRAEQAAVSEAREHQLLVLLNEASVVIWWQSHHMTAAVAAACSEQICQRVAAWDALYRLALATQPAVTAAAEGEA